MASTTGRLYVGAVSLLVFFVLWAAIAAHPWAAPAKQAIDPRLLALTTREHRLQQEATVVKSLVSARWTSYERELLVRQREIAAATHRHEAQLAAARAAEARIAAEQRAAAAAAAAAPVSSTSQARYASAAPAPVAAASASAAAPAPVPRVVTLPPQVKVVTLPPVTSSGSSHP